MIRLLKIQIVMSVIYIIDVSAYPLIHVPFYFLTLLYLASMIEILGFAKLGKYVAKKLGLFHIAQPESRAARPSLSADIGRCAGA
jgi:hypothetical protein